MPADADVSQSVGQTSINQLGLQGRSVASQDQRQSRLETDGCDRRQLWGHSLQPGVCTEGHSLSSAIGTLFKSCKPSAHM